MLVSATHGLSCSPSRPPPIPLGCLLQGQGLGVSQEVGKVGVSHGTLALQMPIGVSLAMLLCREAADTLLPVCLSRISLAGSEPSLVQAAPGQAVQLFCPDNIPPEFQAGWQKEGRPISSNRCV